MSSHYGYVILSNVSDLKGVYPTVKKNGAPSYRASITYRGKHISLGSYDSEKVAAEAFAYAKKVLYDDAIGIADYVKSEPLPFEKFVVLVNFRDKKMYIATPIYLDQKFFRYYLDERRVLTFDTDDLFYYSSHKIMRRGSHLFVADYGSQVNILNRYGIKSYAVEGRDYRFINGNPYDFRYENIEIINRYHGVRQYAKKGFQRYKAVIHIGSNFVVGHYNSENEAAIAYNKAADLLKGAGIRRDFFQNYIEDIPAKEYAEIYSGIRVSQKILDLCESKKKAKPEQV